MSEIFLKLVVTFAQNAKIVLKFSIGTFQITMHLTAILLKILF